MNPLKVRTFAVLGHTPSGTIADQSTRRRDLAEDAHLLSSPPDAVVMGEALLATAKSARARSQRFTKCMSAGRRIAVTLGSRQSASLSGSATLPTWWRCGSRAPRIRPRQSSRCGRAGEALGRPPLPNLCLGMDAAVGNNDVEEPALAIRQIQA
jgi:hypothetical protein